MSKAKFQSAADVFDGWRDDVLTGQPPVLYPIGKGGLERIEIGPKLVTLIGGPPGAGKTAFVMQAVIDAVRLTDTLRALVCSVEMPPRVLLDRQLSRLSGIDAETIRYRRCGGAEADRLDQALNTLEHIADRLCFVRPPFDLENVAASADEFDAGLILLDYIQRIPPPGQHGDGRSAVNASMSYLRQFAEAGVAVVVVAAVSRSKDSKGRSSYGGDSLSLASFRESSELEFGCDDAFLLLPDAKDKNLVHLRHPKARHTEPRDLELHFDRQRQRFSVLDGSAAPASKPNGKLTAELAALWEKTQPAAADAQSHNSEGSEE